MPEAVQQVQESQQPAPPSFGVVAPSETLVDDERQKPASAPEAEPAAREAPAAPETPTDGDPGERPEPGKGKNWAARKIDQLTRQAAEERAEKLRLLAIVERGATPAPPAKAQEPAQDQGPVREQFQDYESYLDARAEWKAAQAADQRFRQQMAAQTQAQQRAQVEREAATVVQTMQERIAEGRKTIPDFDKVIEEASDLPVGLAAPAIATSENPAGVIHYLATHPDTAQKIARMSEVQAAREIGRIEASLSTPPQISTAPAPGKPVGSRGGPSDGFRDDMSMDEFVRWRKKK